VDLNDDQLKERATQRKLRLYHAGRLAVANDVTTPDMGVYGGTYKKSTRQIHTNESYRKHPHYLGPILRV
jgi:hypothetical protein